MVNLKLPAISAVSCAVLLLVGVTAHAQALTGTEQQTEERQNALGQELAEQEKILLQLKFLREQFADQRVLIESLEQRLIAQQIAFDALRGTVSANILATQRGAGSVGQPALLAQGLSSDAKPVGQAPASQESPPAVAPIFEQPGVLTQPGQYVLEPSLQYSYSSSNRVALVGYTIIPALLIGLIDVREVKRNTVTGALSARFGLTRRLEVELKAPYVYRSDATVSREIFKGSATESVFSASGRHLGDLEVGARYQLNDGGVDKPFYSGA